MTNIDTEREAFEKWAENIGMNLRRVASKSCGKGDFYDRKATESAWNSWLARAKAGGGVDGWKLVPIEPMKEQLEAATTMDTTPRDAKTDD